MREARLLAASSATLLLLVSAVAATTIAGSSQASASRPPRPAAPPPPKTDTRGFPRTYHIYGSEGTPGSLARYDMVAGYAYWNIHALRARDPEGIFLLNAGLQPKDPRDYLGLAVTYGALFEWRGGRDLLGGGPKLGSIRAFDPYWDDLYNASGSRAVVNSTWRHRGWNLAGPAWRRTPDLVARVVAHAGKLGGLYSKGWDGLHSDNWIYRIGVDWFYGENLDGDRDGSVDDYTVLRRKWAAGLTRVGMLLRRYLPGKIVGGNGNWDVRAGCCGTDFRRFMTQPDDYLRTANYTLLENLEGYTGKADEYVSIATEWLNYRDPLGQPRYFATMQELPGGASDYQSLRWGFSLATIAGAYYEAYAQSHDDRLWYDEYDGGDGIRRRHWLGRPLSQPQKLENGVWRRDFQYGVVLNNSTASTQIVSLDGTFRRLKGMQDPAVNGGAEVTEAAIPARDGLFLVRVG